MVVLDLNFVDEFFSRLFEFSLDSLELEESESDICDEVLDNNSFIVVVSGIVVDSCLVDDFVTELVIDGVTFEVPTGVPVVVDDSSKGFEVVVDVFIVVNVVVEGSGFTLDVLVVNVCVMELVVNVVGVLDISCEGDIVVDLVVLSSDLSVEVFLDVVSVAVGCVKWLVVLYVESKTDGLVLVGCVIEFVVDKGNVSDNESELVLSFIVVEAFVVLESEIALVDASVLED